jgi:hypothetical protein
MGYPYRCIIIATLKFIIGGGFCLVNLELAANACIGDLP